jgi:hypothetical protein
MSISSHLGIILLVIVGVVTIIGVAVIAAIETRRMEKRQPSILEKTGDKTEKNCNS